MRRRITLLGCLAAGALVGCHADHAAGPVNPHEDPLLPAGSVPLEEYARMTGASFDPDANPQTYALGAGLTPDGRILTLGAGDALGRAIFINDVILAALDQADQTQEVATSALAEVPLEE